jgi:hypothetical protein
MRRFVAGRRRGVLGFLRYPSNQDRLLGQGEPTSSGMPAASLRERWNGIYALNVYHPVAMLARSLRRHSRILRGKQIWNEQPTRLPQVAWSDVFQPRRILLSGIRKCSGNVTLGELAVLAQAAAGTIPGTELIEIGTFDGRTTVNLALNAPPHCSILTLDLLPHQNTRFLLEAGEERYVDKPLSGARFEQYSQPAQRITQLFGDSATFDWSGHYGKAGLVFVDGSHAYDYVRADSATAMQLVEANGVVLWHDYGVWEGVTRALEELEQNENLGLRHIRGTSLVLWRAQKKTCI